MTHLHLPFLLSLPIPSQSLESLQKQPCNLPDFLQGYPNSAYTTFQTVSQGTGIPLLDFHCTRLLSGFTTLHPNSVPVPTHAQLRETLLALLRVICKHRVEGESEIVVVGVLGVYQTSLYIRLHASEVQSPTSASVASVDVECRGEPRQQPQVKNTSWYSQRKPLERGRDANISETVLMGLDKDGYSILLEGLVSNIFVVTKTLQVYTAPDHLVLSGSIRSLVISACREMNVTVVEMGARLIDYQEFEGGFLTNAKRLLVPFRSILVPDSVNSHSKVPHKIELGYGPAARHLVDSLRRVVCDRLKQGAVPILKAESTVQDQQYE